MTTVEVWLATLGAALLSGFLPFVNIEAYLLAAAALLPGSPVVALAAAAATGQMAAKTALFLSGRGLVALPSRHGERARALAARFSSVGRSAPAVVFTSALTGLPPFYVTSLAAGLVGFRTAPFVLAGFCGRFLRFAAVLALPGALLWVLS